MILAPDIFDFFDGWLISLYRITGYAFVDYFAGTFLLALSTVILGELTISLALRLNNRHNERLEKDLEHKHALSLAALQSDDSGAYHACNGQASEAFGRYIFNVTAHSAAFFWPVPFALAWMNSRFADVAFDLVYPISMIWPSTGYVTTFLCSYVLARLVFKRMRRYLPYFRGVQKMLDTGQVVKAPSR
jgi:hypothetical protein